VEVPHVNVLYSTWEQNGAHAAFEITLKFKGLALERDISRHVIVTTQSQNTPLYCFKHKFNIREVPRVNALYSTREHNGAQKVGDDK
jgi:hypothetical protein